MREDNNDDLYRDYVTTALQYISKSSASFGGGNYMNISYHDVIHPPSDEEIDAQEIIDEVVLAGGISLIDKS